MQIRGLHDGVVIAFEALRQSKIRTGLTILGVAIGVLVVVLMAAVIQGVNDSFEELVEAAGPNTFYVIRAQGEVSTGLEEEDPLWMRRPPFSASDANVVAGVPSVENAYPIADLSWFTVRLRAGGNEVSGSVMAVPPRFLETDPGDITEGRFYTRAEEEAGAPVAVLDSSLAADLFAPVSAVGKQIRIGSRSYTVLGVYKAPPNILVSLSGDRVFLPFTTAKRNLLRNVHWISFQDLIQLVVVAERAAGLATALDQVTGRLRALRGLGPGDESNFEILTQDSINEIWNNLTLMLFGAMFALSSVGLMVGGVGVIGVMVVSVTERTREIGVRKSLGATRRDILWQFLVEATTLTTVGGAAGLALGGTLAWGLASFTPVPASIPLWSIVAALGVAAVTGILFGLYPAVKAARLDPVAALRYE